MIAVHGSSASVTTFATIRRKWPFELRRSTTSTCTAERRYTTSFSSCSKAPRRAASTSHPSPTAPATRRRRSTFPSRSPSCRSAPSVSALSVFFFCLCWLRAADKVVYAVVCAPLSPRRLVCAVRPSPARRVPLRSPPNRPPPPPPARSRRAGSKMQKKLQELVEAAGTFAASDVAAIDAMFATLKVPPSFSAAPSADPGLLPSRAYLPRPSGALRPPGGTGAPLTAAACSPLPLPLPFFRSPTHKRTKLATTQHVSIRRTS